VLAGSLLAGLMVILARRLLGQGSHVGRSIVRSWIAISLVLGLLAFCAAAFWIEDVGLRSTLLGGLIAIAGAATAFYFASRVTDETTSNILASATTLAQIGAPPTTFSASVPPPAISGAAYTYTFVADGTPSPTYDLWGELPEGLTLQPDGTLCGTPTAAGARRFSVVAKNALGRHSTLVELVVNAAPSSQSDQVA
jgi:hypothetical protein